MKTRLRRKRLDLRPIEIDTPRANRWRRLIKLARFPIFKQLLRRTMKQRLERETIAMRAAKELQGGDYANLGIGIPNLCALYVHEGVVFQSENGVLGYGPLVTLDEVEKADQHYVDAGARYFTQAPGMAVFDLVTSFAMIKSGRLISIMGGVAGIRKG